MVAPESPVKIPGNEVRQRTDGQSLRYRERVKSRKPPEPEAVNDPARVFTTEHFFRSLL